MSKKVSGKTHTQEQLNDHSKQLNPNYRTNGTNAENSAVHGNRGEQLNPNQTKPEKQ